MNNPSTDWSQIFSCRQEMHRRWPEIWDVPLIKNRSRFLGRWLKEGMKVLDVGAGPGDTRTLVEKLNIRIDYKSLDVDRRHEHDFYDIREVDELFDAVLLFEVIEHLSLEEGIDLFQRLKGILRPGGIIALSTPNVFNPSRFMRDSTHRTFYAYDELCGILSLSGFEIKGLYRSYNDALHRYIAKVYLLGFLFRFLGIDYANSIFAVGEARLQDMA